MKTLSFVTSLLIITASCSKPAKEAVKKQSTDSTVAETSASNDYYAGVDTNEVFNKYPQMRKSYGKTLDTIPIKRKVALLDSRKFLMNTTLENGSLGEQFISYLRINPNEFNQEFTAKHLKFAGAELKGKEYDEVNHLAQTINSSINIRFEMDLHTKDANLWEQRKQSLVTALEPLCPALNLVAFKNAANSKDDSGKISMKISNTKIIKSAK